LLFEAGNGRLLAMVDASEVTAIRTAAASAVATRALANDTSEVLAIMTINRLYYHTLTAYSL
jgi:ornithine cyclodeaminase